MVKGWRNDPNWVRLYREKIAERNAFRMRIAEMTARTEHMRLESYLCEMRKEIRESNG